METGNQKTAKKGFKYGWIIIVVLVLAVAIGAIKLVQKQIEKMTGKVGVPVAVETVGTGSLMQQVELSGSVASEESKSYFAPVTAKVAACDIKAGDIVKSGEQLMSFDVADLEQQLEEQKLQQKQAKLGADITITNVNDTQQKAAEAATNFEEAEQYVAHYSDLCGKISAQLAEANQLQEQISTISAEVKKAEKKLEKDPENEKLQKQIKKSGEKLQELNKKLSDMDVAALKSSYEICSGDLAEYKARSEEYKAKKEQVDPAAGLEKAQQAVTKEIADRSTDSLEEDIEVAKRGISADLDGVITSAEPQAGMLVQEGTQLFTVQSTKKLKVTIPTGKNDLEKIAEGQSAEIKIGEKEYQGSVVHISKVASTNQSGAVTVDVDVHIDNPDDSIIIGTEGKVTIHTAEKKDIIMVPMVCLNYSSESTFVYVVRDGKLVKAEVQTGINDDEMIEIVSGLNKGDEIVKNVTSDMEEGMDVSPTHENEEGTPDGEDKK